MSAHKRDRSINIKVNILDEFKTLLTECKASIETRYDICNIYYQLFNYVQIQMVNSINLVDLLFYQQVQSILLDSYNKFKLTNNTMYLYDSIDEIYDITQDRENNTKRIKI